MQPDDEKKSTEILQNSWWPEIDIYHPISKPLQPLYFHRVADGLPLTSSCPIFKLPIDLLPNIIRHLDQSDLANLALVDLDCCQLARSAQFSVVHLSVRRKSLQLATHFFNESVARGSTRRGRRLGPCVRRLILASSPHDVSSILSELDDFWKTLASVSDQHLVDAYDAVMSLILHCLPVAFPNLDFFEIGDQVPLSYTLFQQLSTVRLRHLSFDNLVVRESISGGGAQDLLESPFNFSAWSGLENLRISLESLKWKTQNRSIVNATKECVLNLLRGVSSSVEGLWLGGMYYLGRGLTDPLPAFPRLRRLHVDNCWSKEDGNDILCMLLPPGGSAINSLEALQTYSIDSSHLLRIGRLTRLTRLIVNDYELKNRVPNFAFLAANPQLELLTFMAPIKPRTICEILLPLIHTSEFSSLRILHLTFASTYVSEDAIASIGLISSLEMLWLSAKTRYASDWLIDHKALKMGLKNLRRLRDLAFTSDTYHYEGFPADAMDEEFEYYSTPFLPCGVSAEGLLSAEEEEKLHDCVHDCDLDPLSCQYEDDDEERYDIWMKWHRGRMKRLAEEYVALFPRLEFFYSGKCSMEIIGHSRHERNVVVLSDDDVKTDLYRKWGSPTV